MTKIGKLFKFPGSSKISGKASRHVGTSAAGQESFIDNPQATGSQLGSSSRGGNKDEVNSALGSATAYAGRASSGAAAASNAPSSKRSEQQQSGNF